MFRGSAEGLLLDFVIGNQVDVSENPMPANQGSEGVGVFERIVDSLEQDVFEGDAAGRILFVLGDGLEEFVHVVFPRDGHEPFADFLAGGMEGDGEVELQSLFPKPADSFGKAASGDGDVAGPDGQAVLVVGAL